MMKNILKAPLRNSYKLLKLLRNFTPPPPPPALRHKWGMGLAEVLVAGALGSIIVASSLKSLDLSLQATQVLRSTFTLSELDDTLAKALSGGQDGACGTNLKPSSYPDGTLTGSHALKGLGTVPSLKIQNTEVLKTGADFKQQFHIIKMEMKGDSSKDPALTSEQPVSRNFVIYYKKNNLGNLSTKGGTECSLSNTEGCYWASCSLHYALDSTAQKVSQCDLLNCQTAKTLDVIGKSCPQGQYFSGFQANGELDCKSLKCPVGQVLEGVDSEKAVICKDLSLCAEGEVLKGIDSSSGNKICQMAARLNSACEEGKFAVGFKADGRLLCQAPDTTN